MQGEEEREREREPPSHKCLNSAVETRQGTCKDCLITEAHAAAGREQQQRGRVEPRADGRSRRGGGKPASCCRGCAEKPEDNEMTATTPVTTQRRRQEVKLSKVNLHKRMKNFNIYDKFAAACPAPHSPPPLSLSLSQSYFGNFLCCTASGSLFLCVCVHKKKARESGHGDGTGYGQSVWVEAKTRLSQQRNHNPKPERTTQPNKR